MKPYISKSKLLLLIFAFLQILCSSFGNKNSDNIERQESIEINTGSHTREILAFAVAGNKILSIGNDNNLILKSMDGEILKVIHFNTVIEAGIRKDQQQWASYSGFNNKIRIAFNPFYKVFYIWGKIGSSDRVLIIDGNNGAVLKTYTKDDDDLSIPMGGEVVFLENGRTMTVNDRHYSLPTKDSIILKSDNSRTVIGDYQPYPIYTFKNYKIEMQGEIRITDTSQPIRQNIYKSGDTSKAQISLVISYYESKSNMKEDSSKPRPQVDYTFIFSNFNPETQVLTALSSTNKLFFWNLGKYFQKKEFFDPIIKTAETNPNDCSNCKIVYENKTIVDEGEVFNASNVDEIIEPGIKPLLIGNLLYYPYFNKVDSKTHFKLQNIHTKKEEVNFIIMDTPKLFNIFNNTIYLTYSNGTISFLDKKNQTEKIISGNIVPEYEKIDYDFNNHELFYKSINTSVVKKLSLKTMEHENEDKQYLFPDEEPISKVYTAEDYKIELQDSQWLFLYKNYEFKIPTFLDLRKIKLIKELSEGKVFIIHGEASAPALTTINLRNNTHLKSIKIDSIKKIKFSKDGKDFLILTLSGIIQIWNTDTMKLNVGYLILKNGDWMVYTGENYVTGSKEALKYYGWRKIGDRWSLTDQYYSFDQFDLTYNRPDKVFESLMPEDSEKSVDLKDKILRYRKLWELRVKQNGFTLEQINNLKEIASSKILINNKPTEISSSSRSLSLSFKILSDSSGNTNQRKIIGYKVFINGVPIYGDYIKRTTPDGKQINNKEVTIEDNITLSQGDNKIEISGFTEDGVESPRESFSIKYEPPTPRKPDLYYIGIGINSYDANKTGGLDALTYAVKDSRELKDTFEKSGKGKFANVYTKVLNDSEVTRENIGKLKDFLKNSQVDDQVIVFLSGHGIRKDTKVSDLIKAFGDTIPPQYKLRDGGDVDDVYYYMTSTANVDKPWENAIPLDGIRELVNGIPSRQKILLVDTCQSGEKLDLDDATVASLTKNVEIRKTRGQTAKTRGLNMVVKPGSNEKKEDTEKKIIQTIAKSNALKEMSELFPELRRGTGTIEISAATGAQSALESKEWQNGAFTFVIKEAILKGKAKDEKGNITARSLRKYVLDEVEKLTDGQQTPMVARDIAGRDFVIFGK